MDIYWIKDKKRCGPATVPDVISMVQTGELSPDTLGWHAGCSDWEQLCKLPALEEALSKGNHNEGNKADLPPLPPPSPQAPLLQQPAIDVTINHQPPEAGKQTQIKLPSPWVRLGARLVDCSIYAAIASAIVALCGLNFNNIILPLFWAPMIILEALLLSRRGSTPGKALMGITIGTIGTNQKLTFRRALFRSISVNVIGMGCLLFPVCLITITFSYYLLTKRGITIWDAQSLTLPLQVRKTTFGHYAAAAIIMYTMAQVAGYSLLYTPGAFETIEQVSPDTAKQLREMMPNLPGAKSKPSSGTTPQPLQ